MIHRYRYFFKRWFKRFRAWLSGSDNVFLLLYYKYLFKAKPGSVEDFLDRFSKTKRNLFLIQVGANDGITHDPLHVFIKRDRWSGVLLEPQAIVFEHQLKLIYKNHKNLHLVNAALGLEDGQTTLYTIGFSDERWATGLARFDKESLIALFDKSMIASKSRRSGIKVPDDPDKRIKEQQVKVITPKSLIDQFSVEKIDLLMIDTEGFDAEVVKMFLTQDILPNAIVFESFQLSEKDRQDCEQRLTARSYSLRVLGPNTVAWQPELNEIIPWK